MICVSGKIPYDNQHAARAAANGFRKRKGNCRWNVRIYHCECGAWHLSKMDEAQFKNRR